MGEQREPDDMDVELAWPPAEAGDPEGTDAELDWGSADEVAPPARAARPVRVRAGVSPAVQALREEVADLRTEVDALRVELAELRDRLARGRRKR